MEKLIEFAVHSKRLMLTLLAMILLAGFTAYVKIVKEDTPDIPFPMFMISLNHDGISPTDAERLLIKPMEVHLRNIEGVDDMNAIGREGGAYIFVKFLPDADMDEARQFVRDAVDMGKSRLPNDTREPVLREFGTSENPVISFVLYGNVPERSMTQIVRAAREELESQPLIIEARTSGSREQMMEVLIDPARLNAYNISPRELLQVVTNNNRLVAAGSIDTQAGRFSVRVDGLVETPQDVLNLPIKASQDGVVTLGDVTSVRRTFKEATTLARYNGFPAYTIDILKRGDANLVEAADDAKKVIKRMQESWPEGLKVDYLNDQSIIVDDFMTTLVNNVLSAIILVFIIVVGALGFRSAALVGISVPGSFLFGILCLYFMGFSINNVVMFGLILSVGLLVDAAIVVTEYADRKMAEGLDKERAYILAAKRMSMPVLSSTLTTVAAFLPLVFWPGIMGKFMSYVPTTVIYTLTGSFIMAMIFIPTLGSLIGKTSQEDREKMATLAHDSSFDIKYLSGGTRWYAEILQAATNKPFRVLLMTLVIMIMIAMAYGRANLGIRTFSDRDPTSIQLLVHARGNMSINEIDDIIRKVEQRVDSTEGIEAMWSQSMVSNNSLMGAEDVVGRVNLMLKDWYDRRPYEVVKQDLRERIKNFPGVQVELAEPSHGPIQGKDIQLQVTSDNALLINPVVEAIKQYMLSQDKVIEYEDSLSVPGIDWAIDVDRQEAGRYNTDVTTVGSFIQLMTNGMLASRYRPSDSIDEEDIRIRLPFDSRGIQALDELYIQTPKGPVPFTNLVKKYPQPKMGLVRRIDAARVVNINANVVEGEQVNRIVDPLKAWIKEQKFNHNVHINFDGSQRVQQEATDFLKVAAISSIALMSLILLAQFNSFSQVFIIMFAVIMGAIGVLFALYVTGRPFSVVMTGLGIVALAGIVVNNNIVLIDTYNRFIKEGIPPIEAIIHAGAQRLRPVLLTTITTIIGLLPMALQFNVDLFHATIEYGSPTSKFWLDLAVAVVWGLSVSTVLTLIVTPTALAALYRTRTYMVQRWGHLYTYGHKLMPKIFKAPSQGPAE